LKGNHIKGTVLNYVPVVKRNVGRIIVRQAGKGFYLKDFFWGVIFRMTSMCLFA
jgi:hypothetical protein